MSRGFALRWVDKLPGGERVNRWRCERGILTGRWTEQEIANIKRRAHEDYVELQKYFD